MIGECPENTKIISVSNRLCQVHVHGVGLIGFLCNVFVNPLLGAKKLDNTRPAYSDPLRNVIQGSLGIPFFAKRVRAAFRIWAFRS